VTLTLRLDPLDVQELRFNDRVWIKDTWYFINKISDYPVGDTALVKVDLVKVPLPAIPGPIAVGATGATGGTCRQVTICNNRSLNDETQSGTYTYVDCNSNLGSITLFSQTCAAPICMLFPLINPLPDGFSATDGGDCGATGENLLFDIGITGGTFPQPTTSIRLLTAPATGGTGGPYTTSALLSYATNNNIQILSRVPDGVFAKVELSSTLATGATFGSSQIVLNVNGTPVATTTVTGSYAKSSAVFPSAINVLNDYTIDINFDY
jgi:hypothetical protein